MYRVLSEKYGWTPAQIASMTPAQIQMYADDDGTYRTGSGRRVRKLPRAEARRLRAELKGIA